MSDVNYDQSPAMMAARGQTYGKRKQQIDAQRAVPMGPSPTAVVQQPKPTVRPGSLTPLTAPSGRPDEPITAGANFGPGVNSMGAGIMPTPEPTDDVLNKLVYLNSIYPNKDVENLISTLRNGRQ